MSCTKEDGLIKVVTTSTNICLPVLDLSLALDIALGYACIIALVITTAIVITLVDDDILVLDDDVVIDVDVDFDNFDQSSLFRTTHYCVHQT